MTTVPDPTARPASPARRLAVVMCMDARIDPNAALGLSLGDAHIIRNAGGIVTADVLRSLFLSQRLLGTRSIALIHHTDCGIEGLDGAALTASLTRELGSAPPFAVEGFDDPADDVRKTAAELRACPFLEIEQLDGYVYDVEEKRLIPVPLDG